MEIAEFVSALHDRALAERWLAHLMAAASPPQALSPGPAATATRRHQPRGRKVFAADSAATNRAAEGHHGLSCDRH